MAVSRSALETAAHFFEQTAREGFSTAGTNNLVFCAQELGVRILLRTFRPCISSEVVAGYWDECLEEEKKKRFPQGYVVEVKEFPLGVYARPLDYNPSNASQIVHIRRNVVATDLISTKEIEERWLKNRWKNTFATAPNSLFRRITSREPSHLFDTLAVEDVAHIASQRMQASVIFVLDANRIKEQLPEEHGKRLFSAKGCFMNHFLKTHVPKEAILRAIIPHSLADIFRRHFPTLLAYQLPCRPKQRVLKRGEQSWKIDVVEPMYEDVLLDLFKEVFEEQNARGNLFATPEEMTPVLFCAVALPCDTDMI